MPESSLATGRPLWRMPRLTLRAKVLGLLLVLLVALGASGATLAPYDPIEPNTSHTLEPPSLAHPFGTDQLGRDVLSRVIAATRIDLGIAMLSVLLSLVAGTLAGAAAGWAGAWVDRIVSRLVDTIMAFPLFLLAVGIAAALGNSVSSVVIATSIVNLPFYARHTRAEVSRRRSAGYVEAARLAGIGPIALVAVHILPNIAGPLMVQSSLNLGWAILNSAGLSFIGLGVRPPQPEWGIMVSEGAGYIFSGEWWLFVFPGTALMLAVLLFSLTGDWLRDIFDPQRRVRTP